MKTPRCVVPAIILLLTLSPSTVSAQYADLDAYWDAVSETVANGDFDGYAALYHPDAVLVSDFSSSSISMVTALANWKQGFDDTRDGKMKANVDFRFEKRYNNGEAAWESGIFRYSATPEGGTMSTQYIFFEALMVNKGEGWLMVMERQIAQATEAQWDALADASN